MTLLLFSNLFSLRLRNFFLTKPIFISRRLILQQAHGQFFKPPIICKLKVSCSISLPDKGSISPFPHGTISLLVTQKYLALQGGPCWFTPNFTCLMLLGVFSLFFCITGLSPSMVQDSADSFKKLNFDNPHNPKLILV